MLTIRHSRQSLQPDGSDADLIQPSDWNNDHVIDGDLLEFQGPQGVAGADGAQGPQGVAGADGAAGPAGAAGAQGPQGVAGADGAAGPAGADGAQGPQGVAGVDGAGGLIATLSGKLQMSILRSSALTITNYDSASTYAVSATGGAVSILQDEVTFVAGAVAGAYALSVSVNGLPRSVPLTVLPDPVPPVINCLVAAGGGGNYSGTGRAAGSGGGGLLIANVSAVEGVLYDVIVGAGGYQHANGNNSSFRGLLAIGGGAGAAEGGHGNAGGSGGGSWYTTGTTAAGTAGQGNSGGSSGLANNYAGGGGGGAGSAGGVATRGAGVVSSLSGDAVEYCRGGLSNHWTVINYAVNGTAFTGEGASGNGNGGSGIVIFRYPDVYEPLVVVSGTPEIKLLNGYRIYIFRANGSVRFGSP